MSQSALIRDALKQLVQSDGKLTAASVVEAAADPESPLHSRFEWDDAKASYEHRLWQARQLIVSVKISFDGPEERVCQAFVSLKPDRKEENGGYRQIADVMSSKALRAELLKTAMEELKAFEERYERFKELAPIFDAAKRVAAKVKQKQQAA